MECALRLVAQGIHEWDGCKLALLSRILLQVPQPALLHPEALLHRLALRRASALLHQLALW